MLRFSGVIMMAVNILLMKPIILFCLPFLILMAAFSSKVEAAPGDLQLEVMTRTGDASVGPGGKALTNLETYFSGERRSLGISSDGRIFFAGEYEVEGEEEPGFYAVGQSGGLSTIAEAGASVPGVVVGGAGVVSKEAPWSAISTSEGGRFQAVGMWSDFFNQEAGFRFNQNFLYRAENLVVGSHPLAWSKSGGLNPKGNFIQPMMITDHRGETVEYFHGGGGAAMMVSNLGTLCWETKTGVFSEIIKASRVGGVSAVVLKDTPAPGFSTEDNASFSEQNRLLGIDESDRIYFLAVVETTGGGVGTIYRHDPVTSVLTVMFIGGKTEFPRPDGAAPLTRAVAAEDVHVALNGELYLRVPFTTSFAGFWKILADGTVEYLRTISDFETIPTNQGGVRLRGVSTGDWAVGNDDVIYFTSAVRLGGGGSDHGVWKFDPATGVVTTLGRKPFEGEFGDAPGTEATYVRFSNLTACGEYVVFIAELSDGTKGIFGTDNGGGVIKIILEGEALDESVVEDLYFSPDTTGESLRVTQGMKGLNGLGELAFVADLANDESVLVKASYEGNRVASGDIYVWDGGAGDFDWHGVSGGRSNWVDGNGVPRAEPPPVDGTAEVRIETEVMIAVSSSPVEVKSLKVAQGGLKIESNFKCEAMTVESNGSLVLREGEVKVDVVELDGLFEKEGEGVCNFEVGVLLADAVPFSVDGGELHLSVVEGEFKNSPWAVGDAHLIFNGSVVMSGQLSGFLVRSSSGRVTWESGVIRLPGTTVFDAVAPGSEIRWGGDSVDPISFEVGGENAVLEIRGAGEQTVGKSITIPRQLTVHVINEPTPSGNGFVIDPGVDETLKVEGRLISEGVMLMRSGELDQAEFGLITLGGESVIESGFTKIDGWISGLLVQLADVNYEQLRFTESAVHRIRESRLTPGEGINNVLWYHRGSRVEPIGSGESFIEWKSDVTGTFDARINMQDESKLTLCGAEMDAGLFGNTFNYTVPLGCELTLKDFEPMRCRVFGEGVTKLTGEIRSSVVTEFSIETEIFEIIDARIFGFEGLMSKRSQYFFSGPSQLGTIQNCIVGEKVEMIFGSSSVVEIDGPFALGSPLVVKGILELKSDIQELLGSDEGKVHLESTNPVNGIVIPANRPQSIEIGVPLSFEFGTEVIYVGNNSRLVLPSRALGEVVVNGILEKGSWEISPGARCELTTSEGTDEIFGIGAKASMKLGTAPVGGKLFGDLPSFTHSFSVGGKLELDGTVFDLGGGTLSNRKQIEMKNGAKVIGDVQSIRNDVQGVVPLSGNIVIEGNLACSGVISLGASPGVGLITGNLTLLPGCEMIVEFSGTEPGTEFDFLEVGGEVILDGKLTLKLLDDYMPPVGQDFELISAGGISGSFVEIDQSEVGRTRRFGVTASGTGVSAEMESIFFADFEGWRGYFFSPTDQSNDLVSGPNADPDGDGKDNLMEYATNGLPMTPDSEPLVFENGMLSLTWANGVNDLIWELSTSSGLETWETIPHSTNLLEAGIDTSIFELEVSPVLRASPERYYQIEVVPLGP